MKKSAAAKMYWFNYCAKKRYEYEIKKNKKNKKKSLTKLFRFDSIFLVSRKIARQKDNENRRRSKRQERKD